MLQEQDKKQENWEPSPPKLDDQTPSLGTQATGNPDTQKQDKEYPSRQNRVKISARVDAQKVEKYRLWCFVNKVDMQTAIERGLDWVTGNLGTQEPTINDLDDLDDIKNDDALIFYQRWTKNKANEKDKEAYKEVEHLAPHIIKAGILISVIRSKSKIRSFRYCLGAIQETAETNPGQEYFGYLLEQVKRKM